MLIDNLTTLFLVHTLPRNRPYLLTIEVSFSLPLLACVEWNAKTKIVKRTNYPALIFVILIIDCIAKADHWQYILVETLYFPCQVILQLWKHIAIRDS